MVWTRPILFGLVALSTSFLCSCTLFESTASPAEPQAGADCPVDGEVYQGLVCARGTWLENTAPTSEGTGVAAGVYPGAATLESETYELTGELAPSIGARGAESETYELELTPVISESP